MITRTVGPFVLSLLLGVSIACGDTTPSPTPTPPQAVVEPTPEPTVATRGVVTGTVTYRERIALTPDAVVEVELLDVSRADAPSVTIGEQIIENPGQVPIVFEIKYDPANIDSRFSYAIRAVIKEGDKLAFTTDTRYSVITRDNPAHVDLVLVRVGAAPTEPTTPTTATVTGTVTYRERIALAPDAVVEVKLLDVSRADAPAVTIGEQVIENPGQVPISFEVEYDPADIDERFTYAIQVRIMEGDSLAFINDTTYPVITRDSPIHVDMVLVKVGGTPTEPTPEPTMVEVAAPIDEVEINIAESLPPQYFVAVRSGLPNACYDFNAYDVSRDGDTVRITVTNLKPEQPQMCAEIYRTVESNIALGSDFEGGKTYTVQVNDVTETFVTQLEEPAGPTMISVLAPVQSVRVNVTDSEPPEYSLTVLSKLPLGTSCSSFEGYEVTQDETTVSVTVTNLEVAPGQVVPCTADFGHAETEIPLGSDLTAGEAYTVVVNGEVTNSFLARDDRTNDWVVETSPIETVEVVVSDSEPPQYSLNVVSRLPAGSSCSAFNGYNITRPFAGRVEVTVTHLEVSPGQVAPCTADLPVVSTDIPLGSSLAAGETYTVVVNGEVTNSFLARDDRTTDWVVKASPVETVAVLVSDSEPPQYSLNVVSRLPAGSSCSAFNGYDIARPFAGRIEVTVTHLEVPPGQLVPCTADLPVVSTEIPLGSNLTAGEAYTVAVNEGVTNSFLARDDRTSDWVLETSPIETVEVAVSDSEPPQYSLSVVSRLPRGSSCSEFNGYGIARRFAGRIEVTVTHLEVPPGQVAPCTADLPVVSTDIPLGSSLAAGETYTVVVNGEVTNSFIARDDRTSGWVVKTSPIERAEMVVSDSEPPMYAMNVVSRLPRGSSCSAFNGYDIARQFPQMIEVTVTHLEVAEDLAPCTRDLPAVSTQIRLGSGFTAGDTYLVVVNGDVTETFTAQIEFAFGFESDDEGWITGFADLPANFDQSTFELDSGHRALPAGLDGSGMYVQGHNRSDDLFMFLKRQVQGLRPETAYTVTVSIDLATNVPGGLVGIGGSPGESVYVKAGASAVEPIVEEDDAGHLRMNIDKGNQAAEGEAMINLGNVAHAEVIGEEYKIKTLHNQGRPFEVVSDNEGRTWLIVGTDSGFEGLSSIYFARITYSFTTV